MIQYLYALTYRAFLVDRCWVIQTAIVTYIIHTSIVTVRQTIIEGFPGALVRLDSGARMRRRPVTPYVKGLARMIQESQPDSAAGKKEPESNHIGIKKTDMIA